MGAEATGGLPGRTLEFFGGRRGNVDLGGRRNSRPSSWYFAGERRSVPFMILRVVGAASIFMGRTPHEVRGELNRRAR